MVDASTGELSIREPIDREGTPGPLVFYVIASDMSANISQRNIDNATVTIYGEYYYYS